MIKSVNQDQHEILMSIMELCGIDRFCADLTYGNGAFYKNIEKPLHRFDIDRDLDDVTNRCSFDTGIESKSIFSAVYDPPFLTYIKQARDHNSIMGKRFGGYWSYDELQSDYQKTIIEAYRILQKKGFFVVKCQDIIHNHKMHCTHANIINWSDGYFRLKDLYVLTAKNRMPIPQAKNTKKKVQKHARIHHSYFMVLERL